MKPSIRMNELLRKAKVDETSMEFDCLVRFLDEQYEEKENGWTSTNNVFDGKVSERNALIDELIEEVFKLVLDPFYAKTFIDILKSKKK